jgi:uncharacterized protein YecE (DUF72 family)
MGTTAHERASSARASHRTPRGGSARSAHRGTRVRVGTSGWVYRDWRGAFYPQTLPVARWFDYYARSFDTVEINNTFYRLPDEAAFRAWREQAPAGFLYALKASRYLTHMKKLREPSAPLERLLVRARLLGPHLGPVLYQLPPHWGCNVERLRAFIAQLPAGVDHVFEFRDPSWFHDEVRALLEEARVGFCIHDLHGLRCPHWTPGRVVYVRFHGPTEVRYAGSYGRAQLRRWAERIEGFRRAGREVYAYFNNDVAGHAVANARTLAELLEAEAAGAHRRAS